jgi:hypothetical protein
MNDETISAVSLGAAQSRLPRQAAPIARQLLSSSALRGNAGVEPSAWFPIDPVLDWVTNHSFLPTTTKTF